MALARWGDGVTVTTIAVNHGATQRADMPSVIDSVRSRDTGPLVVAKGMMRFVIAPNGAHIAG